MSGEIRPFELMKQLGMSKSTYYRYITATSLDIPKKPVNKPFLGWKSALLHTYYTFFREIAWYDYIKWIIDIMVYMPYNIYKGDYMTKFKLIAYEKENGEVPVEEFLDSVNPKMRAKIFGLLGILQEKGNMLREPYSKHLDDGIFELRCKFGSDITRVLYFFYYEGKIILTNGFVKKTQKTPKEEIQIAKDRRKNFIERVMKDENI